jgi:hypothetical protein
MDMTRIVRYPLWAFACVMLLGFLSICGREYRHGLEVKTPLFTDHFIELR